MCAIFTCSRLGYYFNAEVKNHISYTLIPYSTPYSAFYTLPAVHVQYDWLQGSRHNGTHMMVLGVWQRQQRDQGERRQAQILRKKSIRQQAFTTQAAQLSTWNMAVMTAECLAGQKGGHQRRSGHATPSLTAQMSYVYKDLQANLQSVHSGVTFHWFL